MQLVGMGRFLISHLLIHTLTVALLFLLLSLHCTALLHDHGAAVAADNVARCLSLVFNVIFTYLVLGKTTSLLTCSTLVIVIFGFVCGIQGELDFSLLGTAAGVLSSLFVSMNSIFTSKMLPTVDNDKSQLLFYNNFNATLLFIPLIVMFESEVSAS